MVRAAALAALVIALFVAVARAAPTAATATCERGAPGDKKVVAKRDVVIGPMVLLAARRTIGHRPDAFGRHGYKIAVTLPKGVTARLSVAGTSHSRAGLIFSIPTQDRVLRRGVQGADHSVLFVACGSPGDAGRTGWPGGLVVDHPRCVTFIMTVEGKRPVRRRVPVGRRC